jgi:high-affinity nickel permease
MILTFFKKLYKKKLLKIYLIGFMDCANTIDNSNKYSGRFLKAYKLGHDHFILGDDLSHIDNLTNDEILDLIFK